MTDKPPPRFRRLRKSLDSERREAGERDNLDGAEQLQDLSVTGPWSTAGAPKDEVSLAAAAARHEAAAFSELYRRYVSRVYRYLYSHVGNAADAEDLTAQVFAAAWESIHRYREQGNFASWLFRIARNKSSDHFRRLRRNEDALDEDHPQLMEAWDPLAHMEHSETLQRLGAALEKLGTDDQELLRLRFAADLSYAELAKALGRSEGAVKMALHRLLRRLQVDWEQNDAHSA